MAKASGHVRGGGGGIKTGKVDFTSATKFSAQELETFKDAVFNQLSVIGIDTSKVNLRVTDDGFTIYNDDNSIYIDRQFTDGGKKVYHAHFEITDSAKQGMGTAKKIIRASMPLYEKIGAERIELFASLDNGGYTWARMGFHASHGQALSAISGIKDKTAREAGYRAFDSYYKSHDISDSFPMAKLANNPKIGKHLAGTDWDGHLDLTNPFHTKYFYKYIGYKK